MSDRVVVVLETPPHQLSGGGVTGSAIVQSLLRHGYRVSILALSAQVLRGEDVRTCAVNLLPAEVKIECPNEKDGMLSPSRIAKFWHGAYELLLGARYRAWLAVRLDDLKPNAVIAYHWDALAAVYGWHGAPRLGLVGDPLHLPRLFRREMMKRYGSHAKGIVALWEMAKDRLIVSRLTQAMNLLLRDCNACGAFAAHHAEMFREMGIENCRYFPTPVPDPIGPQTMGVKSDKFKILHIGHLQGIATLSGIEVLATEIIPVLEEKLPPDAFEIHIVGGFYDTVPDNLKRLLDRPYVKIRGQISPPHDEFLSSHVVIVPTPIELGIRVRILTAFSYGSCVVAHTANARGIPELRHGDNCLMGETGRKLANHCITLYYNAELRRQIERRARATYEAHFSIERAGAAIVAAATSMANSY